MNPIPFPARDFDLEEKEIRSSILKNERLAKAIWGVLPAFMTDSAISRMGLENIATRLEDFHIALRDVLCEPNDFKLEQLNAYRSQSIRALRTKPTIEELMAAQKTVQQLEDSTAGLDKLREEDNYAYSAVTAFMAPLIEQQLDAAKERLTWIQKLMEEPDEPADSQLSNDPGPGEVPKDQ